MNARQSTAGIVRERLAQFEQRIAVGVRLEVLIDELNAEGLRVSYKTFRNALSLARHKRSASVLADPSPNKLERPSGVAARAGCAAAASSATQRNTGFTTPVSSDMSKDDLF